MAQTRRRKKKKLASRYVKRRAAAVLIFCALVAGVVLSLTVFFYIKTVEVKGSLSIHTKQEIIEASGIKTGGNIFRFSARAAETRIQRELPYIASVTVRRSLPSKVVIEVVEADNALVLPYAGGCLVLAQNLTIARDAGSYDGKALAVYGIQPLDFTAGAALADEEAVKTENLRLILDGLTENGLLARTTAVLVGDKLNLSLIIEDRIFVMLGTSGSLERKLRMLQETVENKLAADDIGRLDLSASGKAFFAKADELPGQELLVPAQRTA